MTAGKCPRCAATVASLEIHPLTAKSGAATYKSVTFQCPSCHTILGSQIDPMQLKADIVKEVVAALGKAEVS